MPGEPATNIMTQSESHATNALSVAIDAVDELKGENTKQLDVSALTPIADHMLICTGTSARHVKSISDNVVLRAKKADLATHVEGLEQAEWVLIDLNGVIVHIMQPEARARYQIEKLWDIDIALPESSHN